jgi:hypothetical protein
MQGQLANLYFVVQNLTELYIEKHQITPKLTNCTKINIFIFHHVKMSTLVTLCTQTMQFVSVLAPIVVVQEQVPEC